MHAVGSVPFTEHIVLPWLNVIRHAGAFSRNAQSGTSLMVETDGMTTKEITAFSSLLGIFGWRQILQTLADYIELPIGSQLHRRS